MADNALSLGAAVAFYAMFAFAPVLIIVTSVAGLAVGRAVAGQQLVLHLQALIGPAGAAAVQTLLVSASGARLGLFTKLVGILTLFFGACGAFTQLQDSLNLIWRVKANPRGALVTALRQRFFSMTMVAAASVLWLGLLATAAALPTRTWIPGLRAGAHSISGLLWFAVITLALAAIYKFMPCAPVAWPGVWFGAMLASLLFSAAKHLIGIYLARSTVASAYGPAGSLVILLVWAYCGVQFLLFGAEVAHAWGAEGE